MKYIFIFIYKAILFIVWLAVVILYPFIIILAFLYNFKFLRWREYTPFCSYYRKGTWGKYYHRENPLDDLKYLLTNEKFYQ